MKKLNSDVSFTKKLTESAVMLALSLVLDYFKLIDLPYGGSVTLCSMLPIILISYRHGILWGLAGGFTSGVLQLLMGLKSLSYATSFAAAVAIIMLDYILAFTVMGLGGIFRGVLKKQSSAVLGGIVLVCVIRYAFHTISGCTVWAGLSIPTTQAFFYSVVYNATYMLPELLITVIGAAYISNVVDFGGKTLTRIKASKNKKGKFDLKKVGYAFLTAGIIADIAVIAPKLQNETTGEFAVTGIKNVNITVLVVITLVSICAFAVFYVLSNCLNND